jgi:8-hydroxy-5-deazaflavin:NADPH oxidoreductase
MKIGLIGGTGQEGSGLSARWARAGHNVFVGSRKAEKGTAKAAELSEQLGIKVWGGANEEAVASAEVVVLAVPYKAHRPTLEGLKGVFSGQILVDITVPLKPPRVFEVQLPEGKSAALEAADVLGERARVVGALHHVSHTHLADLEHGIECDGLVCGNDIEAKNIVIGLLADLGMRGLDAGPLANAIALESLTPVLIAMNKRYKSKGTGIRITGL